MAVRGTWLVLVGLVMAVALAGCGRQTESSDSGGAASSQDAPATQPTPVAAVTTADPRWHQPFGEATRIDPPPMDQFLAETTMTGKSIGKLFLQVSKVWNDIRFLSPEGKWQTYKAVLDTELGEIEITLRPDLAPNHVRNFIALARVGYYDGLVFHRTVHEESPEDPSIQIDLIEGGCPLGTGDAGFGSIGYWLPREIQEEVKHEPGIVGAVHDEDPDSAACKFYIALSKAPVLDGEFTIFGKISRGLDIARKIHEQPVRTDAEYPQGDRPEKPIVIRKVTIHVQESDHLVKN